MKFYKYFIPAIALFFLNGCEAFDEMFKFESKKKIMIDISFQKENDPKTNLISSKCKYNSKPNYIYYKTPYEAKENYFKDTKRYISKKENLKPFWDIRYIDEVKNYNNKNDYNLLIKTDSFNIDDNSNLISSKCENGVLTGKIRLNLFEAPEQNIEYAGPQATLMYKFDGNIKPWDETGYGNLMIQSYFSNPIYKKFDKNIGGSINFGIFLYNKKLNKEINYIIGIYSLGNAWYNEQAQLKYDPTNNIVHVATVIDNQTFWSTKSPKSEFTLKIKNSLNNTKNSKDINHFYRVNITYQNLKEVLEELKINPPAEISGEDFGTNPADWQVKSIYLQYELEEEGGKAILSDSFKGFEAYISKLPL